MAERVLRDVVRPLEVVPLRTGVPRHVHLSHDVLRLVLVVGGEVPVSLRLVHGVDEIGEGRLVETDDLGHLLRAGRLAEAPGEDVPVRLEGGGAPRFVDVLRGALCVVGLEHGAVVRGVDVLEGEDALLPLQRVAAVVLAHGVVDGRRGERGEGVVAGLVVPDLEDARGGGMNAGSRVALGDLRVGDPGGLLGHVLQRRHHVHVRRQLVVQVLLGPVALQVHHDTEPSCLVAK